MLYSDFLFAIKTSFLIRENQSFPTVSLCILRWPEKIPDVAIKTMWWFSFLLNFIFGRMLLHLYLQGRSNGGSYAKMVLWLFLASDIQKLLKKWFENQFYYYLYYLLQQGRLHLTVTSFLSNVLMNLIVKDLWIQEGEEEKRENKASISQLYVCDSSDLLKYAQGRAMCWSTQHWVFLWEIWFCLWESKGIATELLHFKKLNCSKLSKVWFFFREKMTL